MVLGHKADEAADDEKFTQLQEEYHEKFGMIWLGLYGFNNIKSKQEHPREVMVWRP